MNRIGSVTSKKFFRPGNNMNDDNRSDWGDSQEAGTDLAGFGGRRGDDGQSKTNRNQKRGTSNVKRVGGGYAEPRL